MKRLPLHYWPTTIMLVDDDASMLEALERSLQIEGYRVHTFSDPEQALLFLSEQTGQESILKTFCSSNSIEQDESLEQVVRLRLDTIYKTIYNPERFTIPTVMVIDYAMPKLNGVELCQQCHHYPIKRLMLTGEAEQSVGIEAFNQNIIDKFLVKTDFSALADLLMMSIQELITVYFVEQTPPMAAELYTQAHSLLGDADYINFFNSVLAQNDIVEYYLIDKLGSYLMLDAKANPHWLIVRDEQSLESELDYLSTTDHMSDADIEKIKQRQKISFFASDYSDSAKADVFDVVLLDVEPLPQKEGYYYALINNDDLGLIEQDKVESFEAFVGKHVS